MDKETILQRYCSCCEESGKAVSQRAFLKATGIGQADWIGKYWAKWSDLQKEVGVAPNKFYKEKIPEENVLEGWAIIFESHKKENFPTIPEIDFFRTSHTGIPCRETLYKIGEKGIILKRVIEYCKNKGIHPNAIQLCERILQSQFPDISSHEEIPKATNTGYVYLIRLQGPHEYKIGCTENLGRRLGEYRRLIPTINYTWTIETDDQSGVEAYWHRRFKEKLEPKADETFILSSEDIAAFKRWKRIV